MRNGALVQPWLTRAGSAIAKITTPNNNRPIGSWLQVDPRLLLALQQRFPPVPALQSALEGLVRQHANNKSLQVKLGELRDEFGRSLQHCISTNLWAQCAASQ